MFIHTIHQIGRALNIAQILSEMGVTPNHSSDTLGLYQAEFVLPNNEQTLS